MDIAFDYLVNESKLVSLVDITMDGPDLKVDKDLVTSVIISLFTDRRANNDDVLDESITDRRGWWADTYNPIQGDKIGSRLWLLYREKITDQTLQLARIYAYEALQWLVEDNVASSILITASKIYTNILGLQVTIAKPQGVDTFKFQYVWEQL